MRCRGKAFGLQGIDKVEELPAVDIDAAPKRLLLCSSDVPDKEKLLDAVRPWVTVVEYNFEEGLDQEKLAWIARRTEM